jgi:DNA polymerase III alpha subunit
MNGGCVILPELYFKSPAEMSELFRDFPEAVANTLKIAERCNLNLEFGISKYPEYPIRMEKLERAICMNCANKVGRAIRRTSWNDEELRRVSTMSWEFSRRPASSVTS